VAIPFRILNRVMAHILWGVGQSQEIPGPAMGDGSKVPVWDSRALARLGHPEADAPPRNRRPPSLAIYLSQPMFQRIDIVGDVPYHSGGRLLTAFISVFGRGFHCPARSWGYSRWEPYPKLGMA
jgi:hypothetical protein